MPAELNPDSDGWVCPEHPDYHPMGLITPHAINSMNKHNREFHAEGERAELVALLQSRLFSKRELNDRQAGEIADMLLADGWHRAPF